MGYSKCAAPGCRSRPGEGLCFKYYPKDARQLEAWLHAVPVLVKYRQTALCEKHFKTTDVVNEPSGRKIVSTAVPISSHKPAAPAIIPFRDITNINPSSLKTMTPRTPLSTRTSTTPRKSLFYPNESIPSPILETHLLNETSNSILQITDSSDNSPSNSFLDSLDESIPSPILETHLLINPSSLKTMTPRTPLSTQTSTTPRKSLFYPNESIPSPIFKTHLLNETSNSILQITDSSDNSPSNSFLDSLDESIPSPILETHLLINPSSLKTMTPRTPLSTQTSTTPRKSLFYPNESIPSPIFKTHLLNETSNSILQITDSSDNSPSNSFLNSLDERTGLFCFIPDVPITEKEIVSTEQIITSLDDKIFRLSEESAAKDVIITQQSKRIKILETENDEVKKKVVTITKAKQRVEGKLKRFTSILSERQIERLTRRSSKGLTWGMEEVQEGLILKMKCGTSGYNAWVKRYPILPAVRTLQLAVQFIRFDSGILYSVFDMLQCMVNDMPDMERDCQLVFDEMQLEETPKYDLALKKWVGNATLSTHSGVAKKALLFLLAGISRRWKVAVAVEFTNSKSTEAKENKENTTGLAYKKIVDTIIIKAESIGLRVCNMTTDMGADNLAVWRLCGVPSGRTNETSCFFPNPVRKNSKVFILPDSVHLMKAVKSMLDSNVTVTLPPDVIEEEGLSSPIVDYRHVDDLYEFENSSELKVAFRLRPENIHCKKQFKTMNVGTTKAVLCHRTGVGLQLLAKEKQNSSYATTAWFIILLNTFFSLATCRHRGLAISKHNKCSYDKAIKMIKKVDYIFTHMKVGDKGAYKPVQRGMKVLCSGLLGLIDFFLNERNYSYLMLGRFTSDCIENVFSLIRLSQSVPNASMFLQCLKVVTLSQLSQAVEGSSYDYESSSPVSGIDFLSEARRRAKERAFERFQDSLEEIMTNPFRDLVDSDFNCFGEWERGVIYDIAGSVIKAILKSNAVVCPECVKSVKWQGTVPHPAAFITEMKEFTMLRDDDGKRALQISVSDSVYKALLHAEATFRLYRERTITFKSTDVQQYFVEQLMYVWSGSGIPDCHSMGRKILNTFLDMRLKEYTKLRSQQAQAVTRPNRSSKSVAMHQAADQIHVVRSLR